MAPEPPLVIRWGHSEGVLLPLPPAKGPVLMRILAALWSPLDPEESKLMLLPIEGLSRFVYHTGTLFIGLTEPENSWRGVECLDGEIPALELEPWVCTKGKKVSGLDMFSSSTLPGGPI